MFKLFKSKTIQNILDRLEEQEDQIKNLKEYVLSSTTSSVMVSNYSHLQQRLDDLEESLEDKSLLKLIKIIKTDIEKLEGENKIMTFHKVEVDNDKKDEFIQKAIKSIKPAFYLHIVKDKVMYVIFRNHMYKFSEGYPELEEAREEGIKMGIKKEQMPFEHLLENPWD